MVQAWTPLSGGGPVSMFDELDFWHAHLKNERGSFEEISS
jgi:hypothetical protein